MSEHEFVALPRRTAMVLWTGDNWPEVKVFFAARRWTGAQIDDTTYVLCRGLFDAIGEQLPVVTLSTLHTPVWLADANDVGGVQAVGSALAMIQLDADGQPVGFTPAS